MACEVYYSDMSNIIHEIETHLHSVERWVGVAASPSGETHVADAIGAGISSFQLDAGNNTWGSWVQLLGSGDTPILTGRQKFDPHQLLITAIEHINTVYIIQVGYGESASIVTDDTFTEITAQLTATAPRGLPLDMQSDRIDSGTKVWARCLAMGQNTGTINFYLGLHEYNC